MSTHRGGVTQEECINFASSSSEQDAISNISVIPGLTQTVLPSSSRVLYPRSSFSQNIQSLDALPAQIGSLPTNFQQLNNRQLGHSDLQIGSLSSGIHLDSLPASLAAYRSQRNSLSWEDASAYDTDRPNSRLTLVESPSDLQEFDEDGSLTTLESPDCADDLNSQYSPTNTGGLYSCEECLESFSQLEQLKQHELTHTGDTPFQCNVTGCVKSFSSKFKLKRHLLIHSQTKTFTCDTCKRAFRRKDHLKNHEKVHDPSKTVYMCRYESCSRTYNSLSSFKKHQALHSAEEGQLDCKICKEILPNQEEVMNHLKMHSASRVSKGTMDKKYPCDQCSKKFPTKKDLRRHSVVHTGNREFACQHCTARFGRKDHMTRHAKKTHPEFFTSTTENGGDRRLASTPTPSNLEAAKNSRKERSISDPGPVQPALLSMTCSNTGTPLDNRPLLSPSRVVYELERLGTGDTRSSHQSMSSNSSHLIRGNSSVMKHDMTTPSHELFSKIKEENESCKYPPQPTSSVSVIVSSAATRNVLAEQEPPIVKSENCYNPYYTPCSSKQQNQQHLLNQPMNSYYEDRSDTLDVSVKSEHSNIEEMKHFMEEKDKMDMAIYLKDIDNEIFDNKQQIVNFDYSSSIKEEPHSRPETPSNNQALKNQTMQQIISSIVNFQPSLNLDEDRYSSSVPRSDKNTYKQSLLRTQSQDSITRTKNPVLPNIYTEGTLVVPEPKQVHYCGQDSFALFGEESQFLTDEDGQNCYQPWT